MKVFQAIFENTALLYVGVFFPRQKTHSKIKTRKKKENDDADAAAPRLFRSGPCNPHADDAPSWEVAHSRGLFG
jgi:hypothetical protein